MASLILHVADNGVDKFNLTWSIPDAEDVWTPPAYSVDAGLLQQAAQAVRIHLLRIAFLPERPGPEDFLDLLQQLARRGQTLFQRLMPEPDPSTGEVSDVQHRLEQSAALSNTEKSDLKIVLNTARLSIPWAFVFSGVVDTLPRIPSLSIKDMTGFWVAHFNISVAFGGSSSLPRQRKADGRRILALHENMFTQARNSLALSPLGKDSLIRLDTLLDGEPKAAMDWDEFEAAWSMFKDDYDTIVYLYGHSDGQRIDLNDVIGDDARYNLLAADLRRFRKRSRGSASIFVLNGCQTAAPASSSSAGPISANFMQETRQPGWYGFIGTEAQVPNTFACVYGTEFLWRVCKEGKSVGEAFDELLERDDLFPQNMLYACYADRQFRLLPKTPVGRDN
ncbi:hypothetical protein [Bradyrhizobium sp. CCBAU 51753]|uniref:hypothetical protein n=1 Tax=Bradyrhizobium sp. CCBAU 51753 TaxID=1325100 RepID=UPI00188AE17E|nr:hypothetical protein [Bradyrhizobium sp. CCBAU 51753]QOZ23122.1 hypothetical protein XH93_05205 [Bradyrhizobium sp. CCBAU 51753]